MANQVIAPERTARITDHDGIVHGSQLYMEGSARGDADKVNPVGDAAVAAVAEDGFWGRVSFVDLSAWRRSKAGGGL